MNNEIEVIVIKDSEGTLRPQAGIWAIQSDSGRDMIQYVQPDIDKIVAKSKGTLVAVRAKLIELITQ